MEPVIEQHELDFSKPEDWDVFIESAEDIYLEAMAFESVAKAEDYQSLADEEVSGEEIFTTLFNKLEHLVRVAHDVSNALQIDEKREIGDAEIDEMQNLYDELVLLSNHIQDTYENFVVSVPVPASVPDSIPTSAQNPTLPAVTPIPTYAHVSPIIKDSANLESASQTNMVKEVALTPKVTPVQKFVAKEKVEVLEPMAKEISLWGMELPVAGVAGIKSARTLRELLLKARDSDPVFIHDTKKQLAADKLVRLLGFISNEGLSHEQLRLATELAVVIGIADTKIKSETSVHEKIIEKELEKEEEGEEIVGFSGNAYVRKDVKIDTDTEIISPIQIKVTKQAQTKFAQKNKINNPIVDAKPDKREVVSIPQAVLSEKMTAPILNSLERKDPINKIAPSTVPQIRPTNEIHKKTSLTDLFVSKSEYINFIKTYYKSTADFERNLDSGITQIENSTVDVFEKWLGEEFASPFAFIQNKSVGEVLKLSGSDDIRLVLAKKNIKYEAFVIWVDLIAEMQTVVGDDDNRRLFGDLYTSWVIESEMAFVASLRSNHNSQVSR